MSITLSPDEVVILTRRDRPGAQARVLMALGIPFRKHPTDSVILVSRAAVEAVLSGGRSSGGLWAAAPPIYDVDIESVRNHGKTSNSR